MANAAAQLQLVQNNAIFRAFSGANIYATIGHRQVATLQSVTCSITREVAALYSFGDANPKSFVRGKRGIAGTLVFTQYDRHALLQDIFKEEFNQSLVAGQGAFSSQFANFSGSAAPIVGPPVIQTRNFNTNSNPGAQFVTTLGLSQIDTDGSLAQELTSLYDLVANARLRYTDQIPEFDIHITMINENGDAAFAAILGVLLVNEGWGYTLDDLTSESAFTYVARAVNPLTSLSDNTSRYAAPGQLPSQATSMGPSNS